MSNRVSALYERISGDIHASDAWSSLDEKEREVMDEILLRCSNDIAQWMMASPEGEWADEPLAAFLKNWQGRPAGHIDVLSVDSLVDSEINEFYQVHNEDLFRRRRAEFELILSPVQPIVLWPKGTEPKLDYLSEQLEITCEIPQVGVDSVRKSINKLPGFLTLLISLDQSQSKLNEWKKFCDRLVIRRFTYGKGELENPDQWLARLQRTSLLSAFPQSLHESRNVFVLPIPTSLVAHSIERSKDSVKGSVVRLALDWPENDFGFSLREVQVDCNHMRLSSVYSTSVSDWPVQGQVPWYRGKMPDASGSLNVMPRNLTTKAGKIIQDFREVGRVSESTYTIKRVFGEANAVAMMEVDGPELTSRDTKLDLVYLDSGMINRLSVEELRGLENEILEAEDLGRTTARIIGIRRSDRDFDGKGYCGLSIKDFLASGNRCVTQNDLRNLLLGCQWLDFNSRVVWSELEFSSVIQSCYARDDTGRYVPFSVIDLRSHFDNEGLSENDLLSLEFAIRSVVKASTGLGINTDLKLN